MEWLLSLSSENARVIKILGDFFGVLSKTVCITAAFLFVCSSSPKNFCKSKLALLRLGLVNGLLSIGLLWRMVMPMSSSMMDKSSLSVLGTCKVLQEAACGIRFGSSVGERLRPDVEVGLQVNSEAILLMLDLWGLETTLWTSKRASDKRRWRVGFVKNPRGVKEGLLDPQVDGVLAWISWLTSFFVSFFLQ